MILKIIKNIFKTIFNQIIFEELLILLKEIHKNLL